VQVTSVGFLDFIHGQSGVASNGIELHPVLAIRFGGSSGSPPAAPTPVNPKPSGNFSVSAYVSPNPVSYGSYPTLYTKSTPGARCTAQVVYSTGRPPRSFDGSAKTVGSNGVVSWSWHTSVVEEQHGQSGLGQCIRQRRSERAIPGVAVEDEHGHASLVPCRRQVPASQMQTIVGVKDNLLTPTEHRHGRRNSSGRNVDETSLKQPEHAQHKRPCYRRNGESQHPRIEHHTHPIRARRDP